MEEYAKANNADFIYLFKIMDEIEFNQDTDLRDKGHLNDSGANKISEYLGKYIVDNYGYLFE